MKDDMSGVKRSKALSAREADMKYEQLKADGLWLWSSFEARWLAFHAGQDEAVQAIARMPEDERKRVYAGFAIAIEHLIEERAEEKAKGKGDVSRPLRRVFVEALHRCGPDKLFKFSAMLGEVLVERARRAIATDVRQRRRIEARYSATREIDAFGSPGYQTEDLLEDDLRYLRAHLTETEWQLVELQVTKRCTDAEIAQALGLTLSQLTSRWHRLKEKMKDLFASDAWR